MQSTSSLQCPFRLIFTTPTTPPPDYVLSRSWSGSGPPSWSADSPWSPSASRLCSDSNAGPSPPGSASRAAGPLMTSQGQVLEGMGAPSILVRRKLKSRHDGTHPHLEEFHVSLTTRFYDKLSTRLVHAQNRDRAQSTLRAILPQWGAFRVCYRGVIVPAVFTTEPKTYPLAIGSSCMEWDHCEGTPFQLLCAVKTVRKLSLIHI